MFLILAFVLLAQQVYWLIKVLSLKKTEANFLPSVLVVIPVRGAEGGFSETVRGALNQDYQGEFRVKVVVDSRLDPAWDHLESIDDTRLEATILDWHGEKCSLKCSALIREAVNLRQEVMIVLDSDQRPPSNCVRTLVGGLDDPQVMASCGLRWYLPEEFSIPSLLRHMWSVGGVLHMVGLNVMWGGAIAYRKDALPSLVERWKTSISDDVVVSDILKAKGWKSRTLPLIMVDEASIGFLDLCKFISRQLWHLRVDGNCWPIFTTSWVSSIFVIGALLFDPIAMLAYWLGLLCIGATLNTWIANNAERQPRHLLWSIVLTLVPLSLVSLCSLHSFKKRICWRGIWYKKEKRLNYSPWTP